ncbi:MAG: Mur ligase family protein [Sulfurimonas sp.]|nr:Mur ligase family protein [Sulfurimonas sp.]
MGKSSTQSAIYAAIKDNVSAYASHGNSETGVPLGILGIKPTSYSFASWVKMCARAPFGVGNLLGKKYLVLEMGIDDPFPPKNMEYLLTIARPDIAISLNIAGPHLMQFEKLLPRDIKSAEERREFILKEMGREDTKIITQSGCRTGIYNADDKNIAQFMSKKLSAKLLTFGTDEKNTIFYKNYKANLSGTTFEFGYQDRVITLFFEKKILPKDYQETFAATILASLELGLEINQIQISLQKNFILPPGRASVFDGIKDSTIIDSSYNASKKSVLAFLKLCEDLKKETGKTVTFLFGDMRELGNEAEIEHKEVMDKIEKVVDYLYLVGDLTKQYVFERAQSCENILEVKHFTNSREAGKYLENNISHGTILLAKGSQNTIFLEEAIKYVLANKEDAKKLCRQEKYWSKN